MTEIELHEIEAINGGSFWGRVGAWLHEFSNDTNCGTVPDEVFNRERAML